MRDGSHFENRGFANATVRAWKLAKWTFQNPFAMEQLGLENDFRIGQDIEAVA